jgi:glycosyltransferase involved in cell wall biosynthesis
LKDAIVYTRDLTPDHGVADERLNEIYNVFDVMVLPTAGEGFGLPLLEAMAAGVPVIATDYSACTELLQDRGLLVKVKNFIYLGGQVVRNVLPDADDLYQKLSECYSDRERSLRLGKAGRRFAEEHSWDAIVRRWDELLRGLRNKPREHSAPA